MVEFGQWRSILHQPPDRARWEQLTLMAEDIFAREPIRADQHWMPYAQWHLTKWPDAFRELPARWHFRLSRAELYGPLGLVRHAKLERKKLIEALINHRDLTALTGLDLSHAQAEDALLVLGMARQRVKLLNLRQNKLDGELLGRLLQGPAWQGLYALDLSQNPLGRRGAQALIEAKLPSLKRLWLGGSAIGAAGLTRLNDSALFTQLERLDLSELELSLDSALELNVSASWSKLTHLSLRRNRLSIHALRALLCAIGPHAAIESLDLSFCALDLRSIEELAQSALLRSVSSLDLSGNTLGDEGLALLLKSPHLEQLRVLKLHYNSITDASVPSLVQWPRLGTLERLELWFNELSASQRAALRQHPSLSAALRHGELWL